MNKKKWYVLACVLLLSACAIVGYVILHSGNAGEQGKNKDKIMQEEDDSVPDSLEEEGEIIVRPPDTAPDSRDNSEKQPAKSGSHSDKTKSKEPAESGKSTEPVEPAEPEESGSSGSQTENGVIELPFVPID